MSSNTNTLMTGPIKCMARQPLSSPLYFSSGAEFADVLAQLSQNDLTVRNKYFTSVMMSELCIAEVNTRPLQCSGKCTLSEELKLLELSRPAPPSCSWVIW